MPKTKEILKEMFERLHQRFGPQYWWPGETPLEVMVGAILTQNTSWHNVEKAIHNLKVAKKLSFESLLAISLEELAQLIRPAGYFNVKAKRLKNLFEFLYQTYRGDLAKMAAQPTQVLREQLLQVSGIGPETADSILLYAFHHPIFVIDTYTYRVFTRHFLIEEEAQYEDLQSLATDHVELEVPRYNEFHAQLVRVGKEYCKPKAKCENCPLAGLNWSD